MATITIMYQILLLGPEIAGTLSDHSLVEVAVKLIVCQVPEIVGSILMVKTWVDIQHPLLLLGGK